MSHSIRFEPRKAPMVNAKAIGFTIAFAIVGTLFLLPGCGGGGGGGVNLPTAGVPYEGSNTQATLDATTAEAIVVDMAGAELENLSGNATAASTVGISDSDGRTLRYAALDRFKQDALHALEESQNPSVSGNANVVVGNCNDLLGGSYSNGTATTAILEQSSSTVAVKATYNDLCDTNGSDYTVVLNGDLYIVISGSNLDNAGARIDSMRLYMPSITIAYTDLTVPVTNTATITEDWLIEFVYEADGITLANMTFSLAVNVSFNGKVYRFEAVNDDGFTFTEKFYHPDHGYVEITASGSFTYGTCLDPYTPDGGSVTITGSDGVSDVTYQVTVISCGSYLVTGPL